MNKTNIAKTDIIELRKMNHIIEVKLNNQSYYDKDPKRERVNKNSYIDTDTGELCHYDKIDSVDFNGNKKSVSNKPKNKTTKTSRLESQKSLRKTAKNYKEMIISNFISSVQTMFITFTYNKHIDNTTKAGNDMSNLIKKIRKEYQTDENQMKYIYVMEFDHTGSLHIHALFYWDKKYPAELVCDLPDMWSKKGRVHIEPIKEGAENILYIAAYLTGGLSSKEMFANKFKIAENNEEKARIKHARLYDFKPYERFFRHSNDMKKAYKEEISYEDAVKKYGLSESFSTGHYHKDIKQTGTIIDQVYEYHLSK